MLPPVCSIPENRGENTVRYCTALQSLLICIDLGQDSNAFYLPHPYRPGWRITVLPSRTQGEEDTIIEQKTSTRRRSVQKTPLCFGRSVDFNRSVADGKRFGLPTRLNSLTNQVLELGRSVGSVTSIFFKKEGGGFRFMSVHRPTVPAAQRPRIKAVKTNAPANPWAWIVYPVGRARIPAVDTWRAAVALLADMQTAARSFWAIPCAKCGATMKTYNRTAARCPKCGACHKGEW